MPGLERSRKALDRRGAEIMDFRSLFRKLLAVSTSYRETANMPPGKYGSAEPIVAAVREDFGTSPVGCFESSVFSLNNLSSGAFERTKRPGVYVFFSQQHGCIKVGRHLQNASKRALEHLTDNTTSKDGSLQMKNLSGNEDIKLLIFNVEDKRDLHWVVALEFFLEARLDPQIPSGRNG